MDDFRRIQKSHCADGGSMGKTYGCPCCRKWNVSLNKFKKLSRKVAMNALHSSTKAKLRTQVNKYIPRELND